MTTLCYNIREFQCKAAHNSVPSLVYSMKKQDFFLNDKSNIVSFLGLFLNKFILKLKKKKKE